jgi:hypothetical protein
MRRWSERGWDSVTLDTYTHAMGKAQLTDRLFGTELTQSKKISKRNKEVSK